MYQLCVTKSIQAVSKLASYIDPFAAMPIPAFRSIDHQPHALVTATPTPIIQVPATSESGNATQIRTYQNNWMTLNPRIIENIPFKNNYSPEPIHYSKYELPSKE